MTGTLWITGAAGFTGRHLATFVRALPERPRIVGLDVAETCAASVDEYRRIDLCDPDEVGSLAAAEPPTWVVHLAGVLPPAPDGDLWRVNVGGTLALLQGVASGTRRGVRVLSIGSAAEYDLHHPGPIGESSPVGPVTAYGRTKLAQSLVALRAGRKLGLQICVARTFNLAGPGLSNRLVLGRLCEQFAAPGGGGTIEVQTLSTSRDFVDVRDAVIAYWQLVTSGRPGRSYNVCSGACVSIQEIVDLLCAISGTQPTIHTVPARNQGGDPEVVVGSFNRIRGELGWSPRITLAESIGDMLDHARAAAPVSAAGVRTRWMEG